MSEDAKTGANGTSLWVFAVIGLVALCGLLAGLLLSKSVAPTVETVVPVSAPQITPAGGQDDTPPPRGGQNTGQNDVRRVMRNLTPERRREVLQQAMKNVNIPDVERPRVLMQQRHQARRRTIDLARAEELDVAEIRKAFAEVQRINAKLAEHGTALTVEVLQLMTPEERKQAAGQRPLTRRERQQQRRQQRRDRQ